MKENEGKKQEEQEFKLRCDSCENTWMESLSDESDVIERFCPDCGWYDVVILEKRKY